MLLARRSSLATVALRLFVGLRSVSSLSVPQMKTVIVTGADGGIGREFCNHYAKSGQVFACRCDTHRHITHRTFVMCRSSFSKPLPKKHAHVSAEREPLYIRQQVACCNSRRVVSCFPFSCTGAAGLLPLFTNSFWLKVAPRYTRSQLNERPACLLLNEPHACGANMIRRSSCAD